MLTLMVLVTFMTLYSYPMGHNSHSFEPKIAKNC
jgi:hypothetical protein